VYRITFRLNFSAGSARSSFEDSKKLERCQDFTTSRSRANAGQRSVRLSQAYRAIYVIVAGAARFVRIEEVNKHRY